MWKPGTLLYTTNATVLRRCCQSADDESWRPRYALVLSVRKTGYGTKGNKWDALLLAEGKVFAFDDAWKQADGIRTLTEE